MPALPDGEPILSNHLAASLTHTIVGKTTAGTQRCGTADLRLTSPAFPTEPVSVTWGGAPMTEVGSGGEISNAGGVRSFEIVDPPLAASDIVVTFSSPLPLGYVIRSFNGVDQTTPTSGAIAAVGNDTTPTVDVPSAPGNLVVDICAVANVFSGTGAGQTLDAEITDGSAYTARASHEDGAASVTMSHAMGSGANWVIQAYSLNAAEEEEVEALPFRTTIGAIRVR